MSKQIKTIFYITIQVGFMLLFSAADIQAACNIGSVCGQPSYTQCTASCDGTRAFYRCVDPANPVSCRGDIYCAPEDSRCGGGSTTQTQTVSPPSVCSVRENTKTLSYETYNPRATIYLNQASSMVNRDGDSLYYYLSASSSSCTKVSLKHSFNLYYWSGNNWEKSSATSWASSNYTNLTVPSYARPKYMSAGFFSYACGSGAENCDRTSSWINFWYSVVDPANPLSITTDGVLTGKVSIPYYAPVMGPRGTNPKYYLLTGEDSTITTNRAVDNREIEIPDYFIKWSNVVGAPQWSIDMNIAYQLPNLVQGKTYYWRLRQQGEGSTTYYKGNQFTYNNTATVAAGETIDQSQLYSLSSAWVYPLEAQVFTAGASGDLSKVVLKLGSGNATNGNLKISIVNVDSATGKPGTILLSNEVSIPVNTLKSVPSIQTINFQTKPYLVAGTQYAIKVESAVTDLYPKIPVVGTSLRKEYRLGGFYSFNGSWAPYVVSTDMYFVTVLENFVAPPTPITGPTVTPVKAYFPGIIGAGQCVNSTLNNTIYCLGVGTDGSGMGRAIFQYNPATDNLTALSAVLPLTVESLSCAESSGNKKIYCFGGKSFVEGSGYSYSNQIVEFDPATNAVTNKNTLPVGLYGHSCAEDSSTHKIYCFGGYGGSGALSTITEYDPATNTVTPKNSLPRVEFSVGRYFFSCSEHSSTHKIYCFGGYPQTRHSISAYVPANNSVAIMPMRVPAYSIGSCTNGSLTGMVYCYAYGAFFEFDPSDNSGAGGSIVTDTGARSCAESTFNNKIYCFGGIDSTGTKSVVQEYDYQQDSPTNQLITYLESLEGDTIYPYTDNSGNGTTSIVVNGKEGMSCVLDSTSPPGATAVACTTSGNKSTCVVPTVNNTSYERFITCTGANGETTVSDTAAINRIIEVEWNVEVVGISDTPDWTNMAPVTSPTITAGAMAFDQLNKKVILYGENSSNVEETWVYDLGTNIWSQKTPATQPTGTVFSFGNGMTYDSVNNKILFFGEQCNPSCGLYKMWVYDPNNGTEGIWSSQPTSTSFTEPASWKLSGMIYDTVSQKIIIPATYDNSFGNLAATHYNYLQIWTYDLTTNTWDLKEPTVKPARMTSTDYSITYDTVNNIVLLSGNNGSSHKTWVYDPNSGAEGTWTQKLSIPNSPIPSSYATMIYDAYNNLFVSYGGGSYIWNYNLTTNQWTARPLTAPKPNSLSIPMMIFDPEYNKGILYGGYDTTASSYVYDTWIYNASPTILASCRLISANWSLAPGVTSPVQEGTSVALNIKAAGNCVGKNVQFEIYEDDRVFGIGGTDAITNNPASASLTSGTASVAWNAEYLPDGVAGLADPPEYFFKASIVGDSSQTIESSDPQIQVNGDADEDGPSASSAPITGQCKLLTGSWILPTGSTTAVAAGTSLGLQVTSEGDCIGKSVQFEVLENDWPFAPDLVNANPVQAGFISGSNTVTGSWGAEFQVDGINALAGLPEYYFKAWIQGESRYITSFQPDVQVLQDPLAQPSPTPTTTPTAAPTSTPASTPTPTATPTTIPSPTASPTPVEGAIVLSGITAVNLSPATAAPKNFRVTWDTSYIGTTQVCSALGRELVATASATSPLCTTDVTPKVTTHTQDITLESKKLYYYKVVSKNASGTVSSDVRILRTP